MKPSADGAATAPHLRARGFWQVRVMDNVFSSMSKFVAAMALAECDGSCMYFLFSSVQKIWEFKMF